MKNKNIEKMIAILEEIIRYYSIKDTEVAWSRYDSVEEAISDLEEHIKKLKNGDHSGLDDLNLLFAPTGAIQEISISSGWGEEFLMISRRFDKTLKKIT